MVRLADLLRSGDLARASARVIGILIVAGAALTLVLPVTIAGVFRDANPSRALRWSPADAGATANLAGQVLASGPSPQIREVVRAAAVSALRRDTTIVAAYRILGLTADAAGDQAAAARFFAAAERTSRRDQATQAWLIMHHFRAGDAERTIRHFDTALRTSTRNLPTLLPLLVRVSESPVMVPGLRRLLQSRPSWAVDFAASLIRGGRPLEHVVFLTRGLLDPAKADQAELVQTLMTRLTQENRNDLAWSVYREHRPESRPPAELRDAGFEQGGALPPFDWALTDDLGLSALRQARPDGGNALQLSASNGRSGEVAQQLVRLPPRRYRVQLEMAEIPADIAQRPTLSVRCAGSGAQTLIDLRPSTAGEAPRRVAGDFSVPPGCVWQWVSLHAADQGTSAATAPWVDNIAIAPIS